jgi:hypothetical protein
MWTGATDGDGYGRFYFRGRSQGAHRVSYVLHVGDIQPGLLVCHRCDTPACVNPRHLFLGNNADNVADKVSKGRQSTGAATRPETRARGERCSLSRLTNDQVIEIRATSGVSFRELGRRYGVDRKTIRLIVRGETWAHLQVLDAVVNGPQGESGCSKARRAEVLPSAIPTACGVDGAAAIPRSENGATETLPKLAHKVGRLPASRRGGVKAEAVTAGTGKTPTRPRGGETPQLLGGDV